MSNTKEWDIEISPKTSLFQIDFKEIWRFRDLLSLFIKREIVSVYKQTILGPIWFFIQPILTTLVFTVVFGNIAQISTDGQPKILFYLSGIVLWTYFSEAITSTSSTFTANAAIFGKVYFPRIIMPLSKVISNLLKLCIQFLLLILIYGYFLATHKATFNLNYNIILLPFLILIIMNLGMGIGMIVSSLTTKYKDLTFLVTFGVQLLMYASPVIYSLATLQKNKPQYYSFIAYNPVSPVIEAFRKSILGGVVDYGMILYSFIVSVVLLLAGLIVFNATDKTFIDTV